MPFFAFQRAESIVSLVFDSIGVGAGPDDDQASRTIRITRIPIIHGKRNSFGLQGR
jgi:hypothetical protein